MHWAPRSVARRPGDADTPSDILPDRIIDHAVQGTAGRGRREVDDEDAAIESMTTDTAQTDEDVEKKSTTTTPTLIAE